MRNSLEQGYQPVDRVPYAARVFFNILSFPTAEIVTWYQKTYFVNVFGIW
jgi:hypothetical protein